MAESTGTITGAEFNARVAGTKMYKLLNRNLKHNGYKYEPNALNDLTKLGEQFDPDPNCNPGGLYFCAESDMLKWISVETCLIALIEIPQDAQVSVGDKKFKTDKLILGQPITFDEFYSDDYLRTMSINDLWAGCYGFKTIKYEVAKRSYLMGPDRYDFKSKTNLLCVTAQMYNGAEFLNSIKVDVQNMLEDPVFRTHIAKTIDILCPNSCKWYNENFPQHTDLITALNLEPNQHYNFPFGGYTN